MTFIPSGSNIGISNIDIIQLVKEQQGILLTEDMDFGELVFAYSYKQIAIIFLRYDQPQYNSVEQQLLKAIELYHDTDTPLFITVTKKKIRVRRL